MPTRSYSSVAGPRRALMSRASCEQVAAFAECAQLAEDVLRLRRAKGLTQRELAELSGVDRGDLSRIEHGQGNATTATFQRLARALNAELRLVQRDR